MTIANFLTPNGWVCGTVQIRAGRIDAIVPLASEHGANALTCDPKRNDYPYALPGFIDLHCHGGGGADVMDGADALDTILSTHAKHGTTALLATTMSAPEQQVRHTLTALGAFMELNRKSGSTRLLGIHLEGPYLNPARLGAQPDEMVPAVMHEILEYLALAPVRIITLAPEMAGNLDVIAGLVERGVRVQLGHSACTYDECVEALNNGLSGFTHLFNAMSSLHHREPGAVGAALAHAVYAECIPDLVHVHPGAIRAALRCIPKLYAVTDSTAASGMPDGNYRLGSQSVNKCLGAVRLSDGTLAGSALTMDQALRNFVMIGVPLEEASLRLSRYPADYLGLVDRGRLEAGAWADIVMLDRHLHIIETIIEGEHIVKHAT